MSQAVGDRMKPVRIWLWVLVALVAATLVVGGATRLTGSGLSITEWRPVTGVIPPLSTTDWLLEFDKYRQIPQFLQVNPDMTLAGFKFIYWWEWTHRALARLIGIAFAIPFVAFVWRGLIGRRMFWQLAVLFALGGLQGAIGWWMVSSGLAARTDVSQYRLGIHLTLACLIFVGLIMLAVRLGGQEGKRVRKSVRFTAGLVVVLVLVQIFIGALVAKTGAGLTFNTWPLMDGHFIPPFEQLFPMVPRWLNLFENVMTIQFVHRMTAYVILAVAFFHAIDLWCGERSPVVWGAAILLVLVVLQAFLGIVTLLHVSPLSLSLAHQAGAVAVLGFATVHLARMTPQVRP
ncbi:MAG TPA: COX15/CtaA family protein [Xanthobacteraceae bacterium]|nr:COX15/CtaA family protein [Xanthobacteraceae bacterium]